MINILFPDIFMEVHYKDCFSFTLAYHSIFYRNKNMLFANRELKFIFH